MDHLRLALDLCRAVSAQLDQIGDYSVENGMNCLAYTDQETQAMSVLAKEMTGMRAGISVQQDLAGNLSFRMKGTDSAKKAVMIASHIDSVPRGGRYDGRAGILAGLACLKMLHKEQQKLSHDVIVQIFRAEESPRFGKALLGSAMATGRARLDDFNRASLIKGEGITLEQAMQAQGLDVEHLREKVRKSEPLMDLSRIGWCIEAHIEQSIDLMRSRADLGFVTGIRGNMRASVHFLGEGGHTGSTPMHLRRDAKFGMHELERRFYAFAEDRYRSGDDIVFTIPVSEVRNASSTSIPSDVYSRYEIRSTDSAVLEAAKLVLEVGIYDIQERYQIRINPEDTSILISPPATNLWEEGIEHLERVARETGLSHKRMVSGAGHDCMNMHFVNVPTSLVFIPHGGDSHVPSENMVLNEGDDPFGISSPFAKAVQALYAAVKSFEAPPHRLSGMTAPEVLQ